MKKVCVVTGSRAEYGLLNPLLEEIKKQRNWQLQLVVTGMHLSPEFGLTYKEIERDGFKIDRKVEMLLSSDTADGIVKSIGLGVIGFGNALRELQPDLLIVLGDRFEILSVAEAALIFKIPVAHIHGGELTEGAYDDSIRHCITKMSHLHFASTETYRHRIIQLGENPNHVFNVGAIGLQSIKNLKLLSRQALEEKLNIRFKKNNYLVTFHPVTLNNKSITNEFRELSSAINTQQESYFIFTKSNADNGGRTINKLIDEFVAAHPEKSIAYTSMGQLLYLSAMQYMNAVVGNSSSGIIEAVSLRTPVINIGDRQKGRVQPSSIINCTVKKSEIEKAFEKVNDPVFRKSISKIQNPYDGGNTAAQIIKQLKLIKWHQLIPKKFYDIKF